MWKLKHLLTTITRKGIGTLSLGASRLHACMQKSYHTVPDIWQGAPTQGQWSQIPIHRSCNGLQHLLQHHVSREYEFNRLVQSDRFWVYKALYTLTMHKSLINFVRFVYLLFEFTNNRVHGYSLISHHRYVVFKIFLNSLTTCNWWCNFSLKWCDTSCFESNTIWKRANVSFSCGRLLVLPYIQIFWHGSKLSALVDLGLEI